MERRLPSGAIEIERCRGCGRALMYRSQIDREDLIEEMRLIQLRAAVVTAEDAMAKRRKPRAMHRQPNDEADQDRRRTQEPSDFER